MTDYNAFPPGLTEEEQKALEWKIEKDYQDSNLGALSFKNEYITFAVKFYTRNIYSLEDVILSYRIYQSAQRRKALAEEFMADMRSRQLDHEMLTA